MISEAWRAVLGVRPETVHDDFFDLGGTSLRALEIASHLRDALGINVPLTLFYESPTIAAQAVAIARMRAAPGSGCDGGAPARGGALAVPLNRCNEATDRLPLFCAFGLFSFRFIAEQLGPGQPVYGLVSDGEMTLQANKRRQALRSVGTVGELARRYVEAAKRVQPSGPYRVAGFSFGGIIALEMAHQLVDAGESVELVALLDTYMTGALRRRPIPWLRYHLDKVRSEGIAHVARALGQRLDRRLAQLPGQLTEFRADARAVYRPRTYHGKTIIFGSREGVDHFRRAKPLNGWGPYLEDLREFHELPGEHFDVCTMPNAKRIAEVLALHL